jgi:hypothetical protein
MWIDVSLEKEEEQHMGRRGEERRRIQRHFVSSDLSNIQLQLRLLIRLKEKSYVF